MNAIDFAALKNQLKIPGSNKRGVNHNQQERDQG